MKISRFVFLQLLITILLCLLGFFSTIEAFDLRTRLFICFGVVLSSFAGALSYIITFSGMEKSIRSFSTYLMGGVFLKMLFAMISLTIVAVTNKEVAVEYALAYFFSYIVFISFEVYCLMRKLRPDSSKLQSEVNENQGDT